MSSTDFLSEHPEREEILRLLKKGKSPKQVSEYLQDKYAEYEYLHVDPKALSKVAQQYAPPQAPKQKQWFTVTVDAMAPVSMRFRVFAEDEDKAFEAVERAPHLAQMDGRPNIDFRRMKKQRVTIKNMLTGLVNWARNF